MVVCFNVEVDEFCSGLCCGYIFGVLNVLWMELVCEGELKMIDELDVIFFGCGVSYDKLIIVSCGFGVMVVVVLLVFVMLDVLNVKLYDGVWSEWGVWVDLLVELVK